MFSFLHEEVVFCRVSLIKAVDIGCLLDCMETHLPICAMEWDYVVEDTLGICTGMVTTRSQRTVADGGPR